MDNITPSEALLFPADGRIPHLVQLTSSTMMSAIDGRTIVYRMPQPQVHMNYIATNTLDRVWDSRVGNPIFRHDFGFWLVNWLKVITHIPYARYLSLYMLGTMSYLTFLEFFNTHMLSFSPCSPKVGHRSRLIRISVRYREKTTRRQVRFWLPVFSSPLNELCDRSLDGRYCSR